MHSTLSPYACVCARNAKWKWIKTTAVLMVISLFLKKRKLTSQCVSSLLPWLWSSGSVNCATCCGELQTGVAAELRSSSTVITLSASGRRKSPGQERHITPLQRQRDGWFNTANPQAPPLNNNTQDQWMVLNQYINRVSVNTNLNTTDYTDCIFIENSSKAYIFAGCLWDKIAHI